MPLLRTLAVALWLIACPHVGGFAQVVESPADPQANRGAGFPSAPRPAAPAVAVEQVKPDTYLLPDESGRLQPMLGWTFEDFVRIWKSRDTAGAAAEEPKVVLQRLVCTARMENDEFVRLQVRIGVRLHSAGRVAVPLGFPGGILTEYSIHPQDDDAYLEFDQELGEHVLWVAGAAGESRDVQLTLLLPAAHRGNQQVLKFYPPRAAISELTLTLAGTGIAAESLTPGTQVSSSTVGESTVVTARGLTETTEIAWRTVRNAQENVRSLIAEADMRVRAEQNALWTDVTLTVQDLHGTLDRFLIQLPEGHTLDSHQSEFASLHPAEANGPSAIPAERTATRTRTYEVRLAEPQQTPLRLNLSLERPLALQEEESEILLRGVDVVGAVRQQGRLHLIAGDDLRVRWQEGQRIQQVAASPAVSEPEDVTASFEFDANDWQLPLVLALRPTEISVEPRYQLEIGRDAVRLAATFRYSVRGQKQHDLRYELGPWQVADDPQGPETTISADNAFVDNAGTMYLPLANPAEGTFETTLHLKLPQSATGALQFPLPTSLDGRMQDGELTVSADRSLEVIPQMDALSGLSPSARSVPPAAPPEPSDRVLQRYQVTSLPAEFAATIRPRTRVVRNETSIEVSVYEDRMQIDEEIYVDVRHLPINEVVLQVPAIMAANPTLELTLDGRSVSPNWEDPPSGARTGDRRIARLALDQPRLGELTIKARLQMGLPSSAGGPNASPPALIPVAVPQADSHHLVVSLVNHTHDLQVQFQSPAASRSNADSANYRPVAPGARALLERTSPTDGLAIATRPLATTSEQALVIERTWVQSLVGGDVVQTRTVMRFVPTSEEIVVVLGPKGSAEVESVSLNGQPVPPHFVSEGELLVDAEDLPANVPCVLEIVQQGSFDERVDGNLRVVPPRVANARGHRLVYWQLVVPRSWHAFTTSDDLVSASPWRRDGVYWVRSPAIAQAELEDFVGVQHLPPPTAAFNQLLYSGVDLPLVLEATLIRRSLVVLLTSGFILGTAFVILYVPALQRKELAAAAVILLAVAGTMYPDLAPFLLQTGGLGLVLTLVAVFLKRLAGHWQVAPARASADTSIFRRDTPSPTGPLVSPSSSEASSSARTLVPSLSDPGVHR